MTPNSGIITVISGPSGAGKGTVTRSLLTEPGYVLSVSVTTRPKRPAETDGVHYFFRTEQEFDELIAGGGLLEHMEYGGYRYGTPRSYAEQQAAEGKTLILEIDVAGALQVRQIYERCVLIFLIPPSIAELEKRLRERNTQSAASVKERLSIAEREITYADRYDYIVMNDRVENAVDKIKTIVAAERLRPAYNRAVLESFFRKG